MQRIFPIVSMLLLLTLVGTGGFRLVDPGASWLDCLYMAVITLSTVGYGETIDVAALAGDETAPADDDPLITLTPVEASETLPGRASHRG